MNVSKSKESEYVQNIKLLGEQRKFVQQRFVRFMYEKWKTGEILSNQELADLIPISKSSISDIRKGLKLPSKTILRRLEDKFNLSIRYILTGEEPMLIVPKTPNGSGIHLGDRVLLITLYDHLIKLESFVYQKSISDCLNQFDDDTKLKEKSLLNE